MGLDITFYKTKRNDFIDKTKIIYDDNGDNASGDKEIYYFRKNYELRDHIMSKHNIGINCKMLEIQYDDILEFSNYLPTYYDDRDKEKFKDVLGEALNKNYKVYVVCDW